MRLFLDIGAFNGALSLRAAESGLYDRVYAFEPNPDCTCPKHRLITVAPLAAWDKPDELPFKVGKNDGVPTQGSSAYLDKPVGATSAECTVIATDLARFVLMLGVADIDLHIDAEGSEYRLIPHLVGTGAMDRITRLSVEWHAEKIPSISEQTDRAVRAMVAALDKPECLVREE